MRCASTRRWFFSPSVRPLPALGLTVALVTGGCGGSDGEGSAADGDDNNGQLQPGGSGDSSSGGVDLSSLNAEQRAALDACQAATGVQSFENCPVQVLCSSLTADDTIPIEVTFEPTTELCAWGPDERRAVSGPTDQSNLGRLDKYTTARRAQVRDLEPSLNAPEGQAAVFCSVDISVRSLKADGTFRYDDDIFMLFGGFDKNSQEHGGAVLVNNNASFPAALTVPVAELEGTSWPLFDWPKIAGMPISTSPEVGGQYGLHCLGSPMTTNSSPECRLPESDQSGAIRITLPDDVAGKLGLRAALNGNYNLSTVITGDNDEEKDCTHEGFLATVNLGYILLPELAVQQLKPGLI